MQARVAHWGVKNTKDKPGERSGAKRDSADFMEESRGHRGATRTGGGGGGTRMGPQGACYKSFGEE